MTLSGALGILQLLLEPLDFGLQLTDALLTLSASATDKNIHAFMLATTTPFSCASCKQTQPGTEGDALTKYDAIGSDILDMYSISIKKSKNSECP